MSSQLFSGPTQRPRTAPLLCLLLLVSGLAAQTTVSIPCDRDNTLYESANGTLSNGSGMGLFVGYTGQPLKHRALLHFNVAARVPAGARIISAILKVNTSRSSVGNSFPVYTHRVLRNWGEGTSNASNQEGQGAVATTNDATWRHARYPSTLWTTLGGDFLIPPDCTLPIASLGPSQTPITAAINTTVQLWLDQPLQNFGWLLKTDELTPYLAFRIDSREAPAPGIKASLVVSYLLPGQPAASWGQGCTSSSSTGPFLQAMLGAPISGTTVTLTETYGPANSLAANLLSIGFDPAGAPLLSQCSLFLPLDTTMVTLGLLVLDASGFGATPLPLPAGFFGMQLTGQSVALDASPAGFVLSNAWLAVVN